MNNEIKQGDKVRVSKDIPQFYRRYNSYRVFEVEHQVVDIEDGIALLDSIPSKYVTAIPTKYLVKVDAEVGVGDRVIVHYPNGDRIGRIQEVMLDGTYDIDYGGGCTGHNITRSQIEPYTAPKIKVGNRVRNIESGLIGVVDKIVYGNIAWVNGVDGKRYHWKSDGLELIEPAEQTHQRATIISEGDIHSLDETPTNNIGSIKIPVEVDLTDSYWDAYAADLAKELAISYAKRGKSPLDAVAAAKEITKRLKQK